MIRPEGDLEARLLAESREKLAGDFLQFRLDGREEKAEETARIMLRAGEPYERIAMYAQLPLEKIRRIAEEEGLL